MKKISLTELLEAGCHFGHKAERWHPKANEFIYTKKDGIHIIDLVKTKNNLEAAMTFVHDIALEGGTVLFTGTKRQAKNLVKESATQAGAPYLVQRWIGGFITNWDQVHENISKIIKMEDEQSRDEWKKYPKHERTKMARYLRKIKIFYEGVLEMKAIPEAVFIVDIRKEKAALREALRAEIPVIAIVDTNTDHTGIAHPIPANDDAVGSIEYITSAIALAFDEGKKKYLKNASKQAEVEAAKKAKEEEKKSESKDTVSKKEIVKPKARSSTVKKEVKKTKK